MHQRMQDTITKGLAYEIAATLRDHGAPLVEISDVSLHESMVRLTAKSVQTGDTSGFAIYIYPSAVQPK